MSIEIKEVIMIVVAFAITFICGRFATRISKFITLIESIARALDDMKISPTELALIVKNLKEVINGKK